ncbi:trans-sialidase, putative, partial [Trypanosoma cruzi]
MNDTSSTVLFGLSYTREKKWLAISEDADDPEDFDIVKWEPNKTYQVVLKMNDEEWSVFVDKKEIHNMRYDEKLFDSHRISHFYIGGDSKDQSATGGHVTVTNVMLYNEELFGKELRKLHASKVIIPSLGAEKQPTGPVASTEVSVEPESWSEESTSYEELAEDDPDEQEEEIVDDPVPAASSSTDAAGSSVSELAIAVESAGASLPEDNAQPSEDKTSQQATMNEGNKSMQQDSEVQTQDPQSEILTEATDVETSPESNDAPEEEGEANEMSDGTTSPVGASLSMETVTGPADGEHQVQQKVELSTENNDVRSTGTGTPGAEEIPGLEARDGNSERTMSSDS